MAARPADGEGGQLRARAGVGGNRAEEDFYLDENGNPVFYLLENTVALPEAGILLVPISLETLLDEL